MWSLSNIARRGDRPTGDRFVMFLGKMIRIFNSHKGLSLLDSTVKALLTDTLVSGQLYL